AAATDAILNYLSVPKGERTKGSLKDVADNSVAMTEPQLAAAYLKMKDISDKIRGFLDDFLEKGVAKGITVKEHAAFLKQLEKEYLKLQQCCEKLAELAKTPEVLDPHHAKDPQLRKKQVEYQKGEHAVEAAFKT